MRYKVETYDGYEIFNTIDEVLDYCIKDDYHEEDDYFEEWINDCYNSVTINGTTYYPYDILRELDCYALDDLRDRYCEGENENDRDDGRYELSHADVGDEIYIQGYTVYVVGDVVTRDCDGDNALTVLRARLEEIETARKQLDESNKKEEQDILQVIGG